MEGEHNFCRRGSRAMFPVGQFPRSGRSLMGKGPLCDLSFGPNATGARAREYTEARALVCDLMLGLNRQGSSTHLTPPACGAYSLTTTGRVVQLGKCQPRTFEYYAVFTANDMQRRRKQFPGPFKAAGGWRC